MKSNIEIFRTGTHTDMNGRKVTISRDDLVSMAGAYDPEFHEAPIVVGHPVNNDPAMGWVKSLAVTEDGVLKAQLHQVNPDFSEAVTSGAFKKISASLYLPGASGNPAGDHYGLRHVGFLGAQVPAIKGLKAVSFADGDEASIFISDFGEREQGWLFRSVARAFRGMREYVIDKDGLDAADKILPDYVVDGLSEGASNMLNSDTANPVFSEAGSQKSETDFAEKDSPRGSERVSGGTHAAQGAVVPPSLKQKGSKMDNDKKEKDAAFAEREAALKTREDEVAKKQADFAEAEQTRRARDNAAFIETQIKAGKLASGMKAPVLAFMDKIDASEVVSFGEGDKKTALAFFKELFTAGGPVVDFGEHTADDGKGGLALVTHEDFLKPALSFQEEQKARGIEIDIARAVDHVRKGTNK